jgi:nicotinate-nucleotide adenylyltransferase
MIKDNKNLEISDYEIKNTLTYTYQTLDYFKEKYQNDEIYFICGSDNLNEITTWNNYHYILNNYKIIVVKRNNDNLNNIFSKINNKNILIANIKLASISSTNIRKDINNKNYEYLLNYVDKSVLEYIKDKKMYKME